MDFSEEQLERYRRNIILQDVGVEGQERLLNGKVLIIGAGGLGSPVALYLTAAGVGTIGIADEDVVDRSNLQRQIIHSTPDLNRHKVMSAKEKMERLNPDVRVEPFEGFVHAENIARLIQNYDFVVDCTDNFQAKFLINDACVMDGKPFSHGGILEFEGQTLTYVPGHACYRCVFGDLPQKDAVPNASESGVLGAVAGMLGTIQAAEVLKFLLGKGDLLTNRMLTFNAFRMLFRTVAIQKNPDCPVCSDHPAITELKDYE